jgi:murein DD-endopeptidase MepM/ murein hydrolase activator NlpD
MIFQISKPVVFTLLVMFMMLAACTQAPNYAPVKTVNQAIEPNNGYYFRKKIPIKPLNNPEKSQEIAKSILNEQQDKAAQQSPATNSLPYPNPHQNNPSKNLSLAIKHKASQSLTQNKQISPSAGKMMPLKQQKAPIADQQMAEPTKKQSVVSSVNNIALPKKPKPKVQLTDKIPLISKNNKEKTSIISIDNKKMLKLNFQWPIKGKISRNFAQTDKKGIDIMGKTGQAVQAAEAGKAVYCGQGLTGFGNLVIIKHNATYLSAYANNSKLYVKEGQQVDKGQTIGQVGLTGLKKASLHFEIRKNGKPINPLTLMPKH